MKLRSLALAFITLTACSSQEPVVGEGYPPAAPPEEIVSAAPAEPLYDERGLLRESGELVAGLPLPRGLTLRAREERRHVYDSEVPVRDLLRFFGPRVITGEVTQLGEGAVYRGGVPRGVKGGVVRLDVAVRPTRSGAEVEIFEIPPPPLEPKSPGELSELLARERLQ